MRINQYVALTSGLSRRAADKAITEGRVHLNGIVATIGSTVSREDTIMLDGQTLQPPTDTTTIMLNKPIGYVCSREGQGSQTIYDMLPIKYHQLKPIGRLDKDSSGLLLLTNDGQLAHQLTHPSFEKIKIYEVKLNKPLAPTDKHTLKQGVMLEDGPSHLRLTGHGQNWTVTMSEGRNRQIRRTFSALSYEVVELHRTNIGQYRLGSQKLGEFIKI